MQKTTYTVGLPGTDAEFNSIQDAIDQAVLDGHDADDPANIVVSPGTYVEDVAMAAGISVFGTAQATLDGTVTVDLLDQGSLERTTCTWRQVTIAPTGAGVIGVSFTGTVAQQGRFIETIIDPADGDAFVADNTGVEGPDPSFLAIVQCTSEIVTPGRVSVRQSAGLVFLTLSQLNNLPDEVCIDSSGGLVFSLRNSFTGRLLLSAGAVALLRRVRVAAAGASAIDIDAASTVLAEGDTVVDTDTGPSISGSGVLFRDFITETGSGMGIDPALTELFIPVNGAPNLSYAATPADWIGAPPANQQDFNDRVASLLVTLNAGPIP